MDGEARNSAGPVERSLFSVPRVTLYTTGWCGFCSRAKHLLDRRGIAYHEVSLDDDPAFRARIFDLGGRWTVPLVLIDGRVVGGYDELVALDRAGELETRVAA